MVSRIVQVVTNGIRYLDDRRTAKLFDSLLRSVQSYVLFYFKSAPEAITQRAPASVFTAMPPAHSVIPPVSSFASMLSGTAQAAFVLGGIAGLFYVAKSFFAENTQGYADISNAQIRLQGVGELVLRGEASVDEINAAVETVAVVVRDNIHVSQVFAAIDPVRIFQTVCEATNQLLNTASDYFSQPHDQVEIQHARNILRNLVDVSRELRGNLEEAENVALRFIDAIESHEYPVVDGVLVVADDIVDGDAAATADGDVNTDVDAN